MGHLCGSTFLHIRWGLAGGEPHPVIDGAHCFLKLPAARFTSIYNYTAIECTDGAWM